MVAHVSDSERTDAPEPAPRAASLPEAITFVIRCLRYGEFDEGEEVCRKILAVAPDYPDALHYAGVLAHENGRTDEALPLLERSVELEPDQPDWHSNLGVVRQARGDLHGAIAAYKRAIALRPTHANAHGNLGVLLKVTGNLADAEAEYRRSIELNPEHADAHHNLAVLLSATMIGRGRQVLLPGLDVEAALSGSASRAGDGVLRDRSAGVCGAAVQPVARRRAGQLGGQAHAGGVSGQNVPLRAPDDYVQQIFDSFAASFEAKLARLNYRAPSLVADVLGEAGRVPERALDILDVGCGTGSLRTAAGAVCADARRDGYLRGHVETRRREAGLPRVGPGGADGVPHASTRAVRRRRERGHARLFRRARGVRRGSGGSVAAWRLAGVHRGRGSGRGVRAVVSHPAARPIHARRRLRASTCS